MDITGSQLWPVVADDAFDGFVGRAKFELPDCTALPVVLEGRCHESCAPLPLAAEAPESARSWTLLGAEPCYDTTPGAVPLTRALYEAGADRYTRATCVPHAEFYRYVRSPPCLRPWRSRVSHRVAARTSAELIAIVAYLLPPRCCPSLLLLT